jgi:hypothetical protein
MKILLGDFNAKVGREDIFKLTIGNKSLHDTGNDNAIRLVNFHIYKYTWKSPDEKIHNEIDDILVDRRRHWSVLMHDHSGQQ